MNNPKQRLDGVGFACWVLVGALSVVSVAEMVLRLGW